MWCNEKRIYLHTVSLLIVKPQNGWGWKGPLEATWGNPFAQGPHRPGGPGTCPDGFWISPKRETPHSPRVCWCWPRQSKFSSSLYEAMFWMEWMTHFSVCADHLLSCHWESLRRAWVSLFSSSLYTLIRSIPPAQNIRFSRLNGPNSFPSLCS